jgi:tetratricopeptide (TPR) repeat protein
LRSLAECLGVRGMVDAQREVELLLTGKSLAARPGTSGPAPPTAPVVLAWSVADRLAVNYLHLGEPESAGRVWSDTSAPTSPALRLTRLANVDLAALDARAAVVRCRQALELDPKLGEASYLLATATLDLGNPESALAACREGLKHELTAPQRFTLAGIERLLSRHFQADPKRN